MRQKALWTKINQSPIIVSPSGLHHPLTKVDVVFPTSFTVHLVDKEAGNRFEQQAQDGHAPTKAEQVSRCSLMNEFTRGIVQPKMNNVSQDGHCQPNQELNEEE